MKGMHKFALLLSLLIITFVLGGCSLLEPQEAEHNIEIVTDDVSSKYDLASTEIRDVRLTDVITCTYSQLSEEKYNFKKNGRVAFVYVSEGDYIEEGKLMASLDISSYEKEIASLTEAVELNELYRVQAQEKIDFYQERLDSGKAELTDREKYRLAIYDCEEEIRNCDSTIAISKEKIENDRYEIELSKIYATVSGTVSYVKDDLLGSDAIADSLVMKVMDSSVCAFQATDKEAATYLEPGYPVVISLSTGVDYNAEVSSVDPKKGKIAFALDEPDYTLAVGTRGTINILRDEKLQVLSVPRVSVYSTDEFSYVYILNSDGVRALNKVETGLVGDNYVEILSGLELHDSVIRRKTS